MRVLDEIYWIFNLLWVTLDTLYHGLWYRVIVERRISTKNEENISGKVVVVTGGSMGMGKESAREFAKRGAIVVIGDVNLKEGIKTMEEIKQETGNENISLRHLDLSEMDSVVEFSKIVSREHPKIKILLNNAALGGASNHNKKTKDGFNLHVAVNYLGHFLLTNLLLDNLKRETKSRVVNMSSGMQIVNNFDLDDLMMDKSGFGPQNALPYCNTKYCNALFNKELGKRLQNSSVTTYALCPSVVNTTMLDKTPKFSELMLKSLSILAGGSAERAASEFIMHCALDKSIEYETGKMYRFRKHFALANRRLDDKVAGELWEKSAQLVKLDERLSVIKSLLASLNEMKTLLLQAKEPTLKYYDDLKSLYNTTQIAQ